MTVKEATQQDETCHWVWLAWS